MTYLIKDGAFEIAPGKTVRLYSIEHLTYDGLCANATSDKIVDLLIQIALESKDNANRLFCCTVAERIARRTKYRHTELEAILESVAENEFAARSDHDIIVTLIMKGHGLGLAAAWGVSLEADLFFAAASALLKIHNVEHPNDMPDARARG